MNKYLWLVIVLLVFAGGVLAYYKLSPSPITATGECTPTGETKNITITVKKNTWAFTPDVIDVTCGDNVVLTAINEDNFDHGIAIDEFGVERRIPAESSTTLNFTATKPGDFMFTCNVPCGSGTVNGEQRGHFDMTGTIKVKDIIKTK